MDSNLIYEETKTIKRDIKSLTKKIEMLNQKINFLINENYTDQNRVYKDEFLLKEEINSTYHSLRL